MNVDLAVKLAIFLGGVVFSSGVNYTLLRVTRRDVNGLGKKYWRSIACDLRCIAEEEPINKAKILHVADTIDPK